MSKAILIFNKMPKCCYDCKFCKFNDGFYNNGYYGRDCLLTGEEVQRDFDITKSRHKSCPLKPLPKRKRKKNDLPQYTKEYEAYSKGEIDGWNFYLDEILGEEHE